MDWFLDLIGNSFLLTGLSSWFVAQVLKVIIYAYINRELNWERLFGDGGMPSGHSATVSSLAVFTGLRCGFDSAVFAIAAVFAIVVCHDATGVRQETGKQAVVINEMIEYFSSLAERKFTHMELKEFVGHTPLQVAAGISIGIANALFMHFFVF